jgi:hypothetical protein
MKPSRHLIERMWWDRERRHPGHSDLEWVPFEVALREHFGSALSFLVSENDAEHRVVVTVKSDQVPILDHFSFPYDRRLEAA